MVCRQLAGLQQTVTRTDRNMKTTNMLIAALLGLGTVWVFAQDDGGKHPGGPGGPGQRPVPPLMAALDANHDGVIDETEIANAPAALKTLDKNGDGKLTMDELRPPRPEGGPGGRRGPQDRGPQGPPPEN